VAACLKATDDAAKVFIHLFFDEDDAMEMIGHHLKGKNLHLGIISGNAPPLVMHSLTEGREFHSWSFRTVKRGIATAQDCAEEGTATFSGHGDHINHTVSVIVVDGTTEHGWLFLTSEGFLFLVGFSVHGHKGKNIY
jgi:hypothetical protein